jgi:hypothetical protein
MGEERDNDMSSNNATNDCPAAMWFKVHRTTRTISVKKIAIMATTK